MFNKLHIRIIIGLGAVLILFGIVSQVIQQSSTVACIKEVHQKMHHDLAEKLVETWLSSEGPNLKKGRISDLFREILEANPQLTIYLLNAQGEIVCSSSMDKTQTKNVALLPISTFLEGNAALPIYGQDPRKKDSNCLFSVAPIMNGVNTVGYLYVLLDGDEENSIAKLVSESNVMWISSASTIIGLTLVMVVGTMLVTRSTSRVRSLANQMDTFQRSGFSQPDALEQAQPGSTDEINRLQDVSHQMAKRIAEQINELQRASEFRRELVTNVGHDLRTPLASLQGYLESIKLKNESLNPAEREKYLNTALSNAKRLSSIVDEMNDLSSLDNGTVGLSTERITLQDLLNDVLLAQQDRILARNIIVERVDSQELTYISGDSHLLGRAFSYVVRHFVRNAKDAATLSISMNQLNDSVEISFADVERVIPKDEVAGLFDRFFQEEGNPEATFGGAGLAIALRVVSLHEGSIRAESDEKNGTRIIVSLPLR